MLQFHQMPPIQGPRFDVVQGVLLEGEMRIAVERRGASAGIVRHRRSAGLRSPGASLENTLLSDQGERVAPGVQHVARRPPTCRQECRCTAARGAAGRPRMPSSGLSPLPSHGTGRSPKNQTCPASTKGSGCPAGLWPFLVKDGRAEPVEARNPPPPSHRVIVKNTGLLATPHLFAGVGRSG